MTTARIAQTTTIRAGDGLLRAALMLDALVTGANGAAYLVLAGPLGDLLGLPAGFLRATGAFLAVFAAAVWLVATRPRPGRTAVAAVIAANVLWVADSLLFLALGWHDPRPQARSGSSCRRSPSRCSRRCRPRGPGARTTNERASYRPAVGAGAGEGSV